MFRDIRKEAKVFAVWDICVYIFVIGDMTNDEVLVKAMVCENLLLCMISPQIKKLKQFLCTLRYHRNISKMIQQLDFDENSPTFP